MWKTAKWLLAVSFLGLVSLSGFRATWLYPSPALLMQSDCIERIIGDAEVIASQVLDANEDGTLDQVVLYINSDSKRKEDPPDPIYILLVLMRSPGDCEVKMNEYLTGSTLTTGRQAITVHKIEMVELTGDNKPELHIWLDRDGGGPRHSVTFHAIYTSVDGTWKHILGNVGITQCLAFSSFEFREAPTGNAKDIYLDEDVHCEPPWSFERSYTIMRWNGARFMPAESGTIDVRTTDPPWADLFCIGTWLCPLAILILTAVVLGSAAALVVARITR